MRQSPDQPNRNLAPKEISALFARAIAHHARGELAQAMDIYEAILRLDPMAVGPLCNRGIILHTLGRFDEAIYSYDCAIKVQPNIAEAYNGKANALHESARSDEAVANYDKAIGFKPGFAEAHHNKGKALGSLGRWPEAVECYNRAISLKADYADAHYNKGHALQELQRSNEALQSYDRAIELRADFAEAFSGKGTALSDLGRPHDALLCHDRAIALKPGLAEAYNNRGNTFRDLKRPERALLDFDRAIALRPDYAGAYNNKGNALQDLERLDDALRAYDRAISLDPDLADAHNNRGRVLALLNRPSEALESFDHAIALRPDYADAHWSKAGSALLTGDFETGWPLYEFRKRQRKPMGARRYAQPEWTGKENLEGRTLFIHAEQGLGDTIQFCRYARFAMELGAKVVFAVHDPLMRLLKGLCAEMDLIPLKASPNAFDYHIALMSMPLAFATTLRTCPATIPYLRAEPDRIRAWNERLGSRGFKIGICWQGNREAEADVGRSIALSRFEGTAKLPDVRLISVQKHDGLEQLWNLPAGMSVESLGDDFDAGCDAFVDTAAVMECLDLIITSDTAIAHLAGALGRPVWVALKHVPDWRWLLDRSDSPWYPTMKLFRQPAPGDWAAVFAEIEAEVKKQLKGYA